MRLPARSNTVCRYRGDVECIISHTIPLYLILLYILLLLTVFLFVYSAYTIILVKFCRRRRRLQERLQSGGTQSCVFEMDLVRPAESTRRKLIENLPVPGQVLPGLSHLLRSITAAKYILTTMTALSLTWLPWLLTLSSDLTSHTPLINQTDTQYQVKLILS